MDYRSPGSSLHFQDGEAALHDVQVRSTGLLPDFLTGSRSHNGHVGRARRYGVQTDIKKYRSVPRNEFVHELLCQDVTGNVILRSKRIVTAQ
jgi:hypothetical protein